VRLVLREAFLLVIGGTAVGGIVAMWGGRVLERWLYSIDPMDAVALVSAESVLIMVCLIASLGPALRAARADPVELLRAT
jgi:ABC-type antimicrobial peptide transport system permease subunit